MKNPDTKTFAIAAGTWSRNIGNAFFNYGARYLLEGSVGNADVSFINDQCAYFSLMPWRYRVEPRNSLRYLDHVRPDYMVLQGSVLTKQFPKVWEKSFGLLREAGVKIVMIGAGQFDYDDEETKICRRLLEKYPPYVFIARDRDTYSNFHDLAEHSYDGIDNAYFIPDIYEPIPHDLPPYVVLNFDKTPEPWVALTAEAGQESGGFSNNTASFNIYDMNWRMSFPKVRLGLSKSFGKAYHFIMGPLGLSGTNQESVGKWMIIRTDHCINPLMINRIFRGPNAFGYDIPEAYFNLYSQADLTLSDRIHAVLVTLAYGRPAMLFSSSGRARIIERLGVEDVAKRPVFLDLDRLREEKQAEKDFLASVPF